jgi:hypothetical protein
MKPQTRGYNVLTDECCLGGFFFQQRYQTRKFSDRVHIYGQLAWHFERKAYALPERFTQNAMMISRTEGDTVSL